jgi:hypothetical protein
MNAQAERLSAESDINYYISPFNNTLHHLLKLQQENYTEVSLTSAV